MDININNLTTTGAIDFFPSTTLEEIIQNVRTIMTTTVYSVPLDRMFGLNPTMLDLPMPLSKARLTAEIVSAIEKFEPRVTVTQVTFAGDGKDGILQPSVSLRIKEG